jgi:phenylalanyl-tRNA synthetase alpha chain
MEYKDPEIARAATALKAKLAKLDEPHAIMRDDTFKALTDRLRTLPVEQRPGFGKELNGLKDELAALVSARTEAAERDVAIDVTAPWDVNVPVDRRPRLLPATVGSKHPLMSELETILDIFYRMGFSAIESRSLDDDWHMFTSLNFPEGHPARDDYDTFVTTEGLVAPAHTSTMQNRLLQRFRSDLENDGAIRAVIPGRTFRNEDLDARHEHTFNQVEGVYVAKGIHAGHLIAALKTFLEEYYGQALEVRTQPFYFPFTEPSFEFALSCPFCGKAGCHVCSYEGWIELLGCGMIHPNVLSMAGIDPAVYTGFAWGFGIERLEFLRQFGSDS